MAYILKQFYVEKEIKAFLFLMRSLGISQGEAQKMIDTGRLLVDGKPMTDKAASIQGAVEVLVFESQGAGLRPIFATPNFALFDKPSGVLVHPRNRKTRYSLLDDVRERLGREANITHRIDKETSGLLLVSRHKDAEKRIKADFEARKIKKGYLALARGKISSDLLIDEPILKNSDFSQIRLKVVINPKGKPSRTTVRPIRYFEHLDATLVEAIPLTGRQHQIRIHLFHVKHPILGDPIYGVETADAKRYLDGKLSDKERSRLTGAKRLMLHANWMEFEYENRFRLYSGYDFIGEIERQTG